MLTLEQKKAICVAINILIEYGDEYRSDFDIEINEIEGLLKNNGCVEIQTKYGWEWVVNEIN